MRERENEQKEEQDESQFCIIMRYESTRAIMDIYDAIIYGV